MSKPTLTIISDFTKQFNNAINVLKDSETLVGIPAAKSTRKPEPGEKPETFNNAAILFQNEFGSPAQNIPASKPMSTGIRNAQPAIIEQFKLAAKNVLNKGAVALDIYFERAGIIASNSVKKVINDQEGFEEPKESTLAARRARGFKGNKRLIVTGQMRNAITYVVRSRKWV